MIIGELSALGGSCCWATCSTLFTASVRRLGASALNLVRLWFALGFLAISLWLVKGTLYPSEATPEDWLWLVLSSIVGLVFGDLLYFSALKSIGPRITLLLFTLAPPVSALGEWLVFGHGLGFMALAGIALALAGVAVVIADRKNSSGKTPFTLTARGVLLGAGAAVCQGLGLVLSKMGLQHIDALSGTFIRMLAAAPFFTVFFFATGGLLSRVLAQRKGIALALGGAFFGPFLGVTLSLVAVKHTHAGIAMTLLSTTPITVLPFAVLVYKEKLTLRAVLGAGLAVVGVALLFL